MSSIGDVEQTSAWLGNSFSVAVEFARVRHAGQMRKGTNIPYLSHLLAVASLSIEDAATDPRLCDRLEEIAIAALLHDLVEDTETVVAEIAVNFGEEVARIVAACSDRDSGEEEVWRVRKARYLVHLQDADDAVLCVSLADKRHNARCILRDLRAAGSAGGVGSFWQRFNAGPDLQVDQYRALTEVFLQRRPGAGANEFRATVDEIAALVSEVD